MLKHLITVLLLSVSPTASFAPATIHTKVQLDPAPENGAVELVIDGPDYFRSSAWVADERRTREFDFKNLPPGDYEVTVVLTNRQNKEIARRALTVHVF